MQIWNLDNIFIIHVDQYDIEQHMILRFPLAVSTFQFLVQMTSYNPETMGQLKTLICQPNTGKLASNQSSSRNSHIVETTKQTAEGNQGYLVIHQHI